jgi:hypothetical protein
VLRRIERKWLKRESEAVLPGEDLLPHVRHNTLGGVIHGGVDLKFAVAAQFFGRFHRRLLRLRVAVWILDCHTFGIVGGVMENCNSVSDLLKVFKGAHDHQKWDMRAAVFGGCCHILCHSTDHVGINSKQPFNVDSWLPPWSHSFRHIFHRFTTTIFRGFASA